MTIEAAGRIRDLPVGSKEAIQSSGVINNIQYLRGLAAFSVMLFHAGHWYAFYNGDTTYKLIFNGYFGLYGVAVFFAISGFLMADIIQYQKPVDFLMRRIVRIYPIFWIATAFALVVRPDVLAIYQPKNLLLAPTNTPTYPLGVEWSIVNEVFFYVLLFILALTRLKSFIAAFGAAWLIAIVWNVFLGSSHPTIGFANITEIFLMVENAPFAAGLLIPYLIRFQINSLFLVAVFAAAVGISLFVTNLPINRLISGIGCVALVAAAAQSRDLLFGWPRYALSKLGDWSYALYLVHVPIIRAVIPHDITPSFWVFVGWILATMVGASVFGSIDVALSKHIRQTIKIAPGTVKAAGAILFLGFYVVYCVLGI